jgi:hypothetical protein
MTWKVRTRLVQEKQDANLMRARECDVRHWRAHLLLLVAERDDLGWTTRDGRGHGGGAGGEGTHD